MDGAECAHCVLCGGEDIGGDAITKGDGLLTLITGDASQKPQVQSDALRELRFERIAELEAIEDTGAKLLPLLLTFGNRDDRTLGGKPVGNSVLRRTSLPVSRLRPAVAFGHALRLPRRVDKPKEGSGTLRLAQDRPFDRAQDAPEFVS